jgi:hypothetical protein
MSDNDGGPAFPYDISRGSEASGVGMSLLDAFAKDCPITMTEFVSSAGLSSGEADCKTVMDAYCAIRYQYAAAMLRAREEHGK